jgi:hypothetical protein
MYEDGVLLGSDTDASSSIPAGPLTILANRPNSSGVFSPREVSLAYAGSELTADEVAEINTIFAAYFAGLNNLDPIEPVALLRLSKDGARTWSNSYPASIGYQGQYNTRVVWRRLGIAFQMTFEITVTAPIKVAMSGAWLS